MSSCKIPILYAQFISSSKRQWFCIEAITGGSHRKYTKDNGQLLVAGKRLTLGVRGPGEKPSWGETWLSDTKGSQPGRGSWSVSGGEAHIPQSLGTKGNQEGWPILSGVQIRCDRGSTPWSGDFSAPSPKAKPYCGVKCSEGLYFPATLFIVKQHSGSMSLKSNEGIRPSFT